MRKLKRFSQIAYALKSIDGRIETNDYDNSLLLFSNKKHANEYMRSDYDPVHYDENEDVIWPDIIKLHVIELSDEEITLRRKVCVLPTNERFLSGRFDTRRIQLDNNRSKRPVRRK